MSTTTIVAAVLSAVVVMVMMVAVWGYVRKQRSRGDGVRFLVNQDTAAGYTLERPVSYTQDGSEDEPL